MKKIFMLIFVSGSFLFCQEKIIKPLEVIDGSNVRSNLTVDDMEKLDYDNYIYTIQSLPKENRKRAAEIIEKKIDVVLSESNPDQGKLKKLFTNFTYTRISIDIDKWIYLLNSNDFNKNIKGELIFYIYSRFLIQYQAVVRELTLHDDVSIASDAASACRFLLDKECQPYIEKYKVKFNKDNKNYIVKSYYEQIEKGTRVYSFTEDAKEDPNFGKKI